eukprot:SAG22_NODE_1154_length_5343_cov_15.970633_1_plen_220_part_10
MFDELNAAVASSSFVTRVPAFVTELAVADEPKPTWLLSATGVGTPSAASEADGAGGGGGGGDDQAALPLQPASAVVLAVGGRSRRLPLPAGLPEIPLAVAVDPPALRAALGELRRTGGDSGSADGGGGGGGGPVAVLGNSHSAAVALMMLERAGAGNARLLCRRPWRHARWVAEADDYADSMAGLKGPGSVYARERFPPAGGSGGGEGGAGRGPSPGQEG